MNFIQNHPLVFGGVILIIALIMTLYIPLFVGYQVFITIYISINILIYVLSFAIIFGYFEGKEGFFIAVASIGIIMYLSLDIKNEVIKENKKFYSVRYIKTILTDYKMVFKNELKIKDYDKEKR